MSSENRLERLVSNCSSNDYSDVFSVDETENTFIMPQNLPWDQNVIEVNFDNKIKVSIKLTTEEVPKNQNVLIT